MEGKLLQEGDLIRLEKGMTVHAYIPDKFLYRKSLSERTSADAHNHTCIGDVYRKEADDKEWVLKELLRAIRKTFGDYDGKVVTNEAFQAFVASFGFNLSSEELDTSVFAGIYRVYKTELIRQATLPYNAWRVYCEKVNNPDMRVWFYQRGGDGYEIPNIESIGHVD